MLKPSAQPTPLKLDAVLKFGSNAESWRLVDDGPTGAFVSDGVTEHEIPRGLLALPSGDDVQVTLYREREGQWVAESEHGYRNLRDGDRLDVGSQSWLVHLPETLVPTDTPGASFGASGRLPDIRRCTLILQYRSLKRLRGAEQEPDHKVSVAARIRDENGEIHELGTRAHHNVLLELARIREIHVRQGQAPETCGWITRDQLADWLDMHDKNKLNVHIFRLREQVEKVGFEHAAEIIEPWKSEKSVRLGLREFEIHAT